MEKRAFILGAGVTGLAAGWASGLDLYEAEQAPGGICCSYYGRSGGALSPCAPEDGEAYRFEIGGGHWIFGGDPTVLRFVRSLTPVKSYQRRASVFFSKQNLHVPYPLQNHLSFLGQDLASRAIREMSAAPKGAAVTLADWIGQTFGSTLTELFFGPFHELYTAGLWTRIAPQDEYKSPVNMAHVLAGASQATPPVGYNVSFLYPLEGLDMLARRLAGRSVVHYGRRVVSIDLRQRVVTFEDGGDAAYDTLICTLPLNHMVKMTGSVLEEEPDPYTSVLVLNVGAVRGPHCPEDHWVYIPDCGVGFHRVGFYSNTDPLFLPRSSQAERDRVSVYVERAYSGGQKPGVQEVEEYSARAVRQLQDWGFIGAPEVVHPTWIDVAYTWSRPGSRWRVAALKHMEENQVVMVGRYARWVFQGIADSIRDGLLAGATALQHPA